MRLWIKSHLKLKRGWSWTKCKMAKHSWEIKWKEQEIIWETGHYTIHMFTNGVPCCLKMSISWTLSVFNKHERFILWDIPWGGSPNNNRTDEEREEGICVLSSSLGSCSVCILKLSALLLIDYKYTWSLKASVWSFPTHAWGRAAQGGTRTLSSEVCRRCSKSAPQTPASLTHPEYMLVFFFLKIWVYGEQFM